MVATLLAKSQHLYFLWVMEEVCGLLTSVLYVLHVIFHL
jgi:hypothetical protein